MRSEVCNHCFGKGKVLKNIRRGSGLVQVRCPVCIATERTRKEKKQAANKKKDSV